MHVRHAPLLATGAPAATGDIIEAADYNAEHDAIACASVDDLSDLRASLNRVAILGVNGKEGLFRFNPSIGSNLVTPDSQRGIYIAPASDLTGASGAWVRLFTGAAEFSWFGGINDGNPDQYGAMGTDNLAFHLAALACLAARGATFQTQLQTEPLHIARGNYDYSGPVNYKQCTNTYGDGSKYDWNTRLRFPEDSGHGLIFNSATTIDDTIEASSTDASGAITRGLALWGPSTSGVSGVGSAIRARCKVFVEDCAFFEWPEDGVEIRAFAGAGGANEGNANNFGLRNIYSFANGRFGVHVIGSDANAGYGIGIDTGFNAAGGIRDDSFLGSNSWIAPHSANDGVHNYVNSNGAGACNYGGRCYTCYLGEEAVASITEPAPGMTTPWIDCGVGSLGSTNWVSGMAVQSGGSYSASLSTSHSVFVSPYSEGGGGPIQNYSSSKFIGGTLGVLFLGYGREYLGLAARHSFSRGLETESGNWVMNDATLTLVGNGAYPGGGQSGIYNSATSGFTITPKAGSINDFTVYNGTADTQIIFNPTGTLDTGLAGHLNLASGKVYKVNGTQVVGARGAAVADAVAAAGVPTQAEFNAFVTQFNALLARERAHGLIAA